MKRAFLNVDNVLNWQYDVNGYKGKECLKHHLEINEIIEEHTGLEDGGGEYANWLNGIGLEHITDEGWWNQTAVDEDNIRDFIDYYLGEDEILEHNYNHAKNIISKIPKNNVWQPY